MPSDINCPLLLGTTESEWKCRIKLLKKAGRNKMEMMGSVGLNDELLAERNSKKPFSQKLIPVWRDSTVV